MAARKLLRRSQRDEEEAYLVEGTVAVLDALDAGAPLRTVFVAEDHPEADRVASRTPAPVVHVTRGVVEALTDTTTPQGIVAVVGMEAIAPAQLDGGVDLVLVLDQIRDPGNAGTLVRCAAAAGAGGVFFTSGSVDPYAPKTVRSAAGALFSVALGRDVPFEVVAAELGRRGFLIAGTDARAPAPYDSLDCSGRVAFVIGNEAWGIAGEHRGLLHEVVGIPMPGDAESLNAAVAGAVLLFEAVRQRRISSAAT